VTGTTSGAVYTNAGVPLTGAGQWLSVATPTIILPPDSSRVVPVQVHVPAQVAPGDHLAGIAVEDTAHPRSARGSFAIVEVLRAAVAVELRVAGPAADAISAGRIALQALPGTQAPAVAVSLTNTGQLLCKPQLAVTLGGNGLAAVTVTHQLDTIVPGDTIAYPLHWPHTLGAGAYRATATATGCGASSTHTQTVSIARSLSPATTLPFTQNAPAHGSSVPWWLILLVGLIGVVGGFLLARRRPGGGGPVQLGA
jgi:hypothetical protein